MRSAKQITETGRGTEAVTYDMFVFDETLVISTQAYGKQHACHILKAVDPLPPFAPLATDVDNEEVMVAEAEEGLVDAGRPCVGLDDVLFTRCI